MSDVDVTETEGRRRAKAALPETDPADLLGYAADWSPEVRRRLAGNTAAPLDALRVLVHDEDFGVRRILAQFTTWAELLERLAGDPEVDVRRSVAHNAAASPEVLRTLAADSDDLTRSYVGGNENTPADVLEGLVDRWREREWVGLLVSIGKNASCPPELLARLATRNEADLALAVAQNRRTPSESLARLGSHAETDVRRAVARNKETPSGALVELATDGDRYVRWAVAEHQNTPSESLARLLADPEESVRRAASLHSYAPEKPEPYGSAAPAAATVGPEYPDAEPAVASAPDVPTAAPNTPDAEPAVAAPPDAHPTTT